ncbi:MAG: MraY family glycosyltransferase [Oceanococcus sp.]
MILLLSACAIASFSLALIIVMNQRLGDPLHMLDTVDPQHIHRGLTPRIGGIPLACAVLLGATLDMLYLGGEHPMMWAVLISGLPVLLIGLAEDFAGKVGPAIRYVATLFSAACALIFAGAFVSRLDVSLLDAALQWYPVMVVFSLFCLAGVAQSFNIIDGKNGLALGAGGISLATVGAVAFDAGDVELATLCWVSAASALGLWLLTFPRGLIFLGDGGAYFLGFVVACVSALIVSRHEEVSAWFPLVAAAYPVYETVFTFVRRLLIERAGVLKPDHLHFHSLLYRNLYWILRRRWRWDIWMVNAATATAIIIAGGCFSISAYFWSHDTVTLKLLALLAGVGYLGFYFFLRRTGRFLRA